MGFTNYDLRFTNWGFTNYELGIYELRFWGVGLQLMVMKEVLKNRTKQIGLEVIRLVDELPNKPSGWAVGKQIIRSATSVGANYRAACRAKSAADFIYKLKIVEEEADETQYWLEVIEAAGLIKSERISSIKKEVNEILSIVVASITTIRSKTKRKP